MSHNTIERSAAPTIASVSKDAALELADLQTALDVAHDESVSEWGVAISLRLDGWEQPQQSVSLLELQRSVECRWCRFGWGCY